HDPSLDPQSGRRAKGYRLPNVLAADRAHAGIVLALLGALVCSLGVYRGCELKRARDADARIGATIGRAGNGSSGPTCEPPACNTSLEDAAIGHADADVLQQRLGHRLARGPGEEGSRALDADPESH